MLEAHLLTYAFATQHLLRSIPGIGPISAASLVRHELLRRREAPDIADVGHVGLDCRVHESGTSVKGKG